MEPKINWPVDKCDNCDFDLREVTPRERDKSGLSEDGLKTKMYTDYCPKCGRGYQVGIISIPPENETVEAKSKKEPKEVTSPKEGQFRCTKCGSNHFEVKKNGKPHTHIKYREVKDASGSGEDKQE